MFMKVLGHVPHIYVDKILSMKKVHIDISSWTFPCSYLLQTGNLTKIFTNKKKEDYRLLISNWTLKKKSSPPSLCEGWGWGWWWQRPQTPALSSLCQGREDSPMLRYCLSPSSLCSETPPPSLGATLQTLVRHPSRTHWPPETIIKRKVVANLLDWSSVVCYSVSQLA